MNFAGIVTRIGHQPNTNDMRTYKLKIMQNIKEWYSMPMEVEIEATDPATALTLAWHRAIQKGIRVNDILLLT